MTKLDCFPEETGNGYRYYSDEELSPIRHSRFINIWIPAERDKVPSEVKTRIPVVPLKASVEVNAKRKRPSSNINRYIRKTIASTERKMTMTTEENSKGSLFKG